MGPLGVVDPQVASQDNHFEPESIASVGCCLEKFSYAIHVLTYGPLAKALAGLQGQPPAWTFSLRNPHQITETIDES